jgi:large subunit ribosomal protein L21
MYAILETGGKQYRVQPGDTINVERLFAEPGETLQLGSVLLLAGDGERVRVGTPSVPGAVVQAEVLEHARGDKIIVFRYKSKVRYRRKTGHRQALTRLRITDILVDGQSAAQQAAAAVVKAEEPEPAPQATTEE